MAENVSDKTIETYFIDLLEFQLETLAGLTRNKSTSNKLLQKHIGMAQKATSFAVKFEFFKKNEPPRLLTAVTKRFNGKVLDWVDYLMDGDN